MIEIREITETDRAEWSRLWGCYLTFYNTHLPPEIYASTFKRLLSKDPYEPNAFIAVQDDEAIGLVHYLEHSHCWRRQNVIYLQDLYVDKALRGSGAGRALIEAVYAVADEKNLGSVYWLTENTNHQAMALYDQLATKTDFIKYQR